MCNKITLAFGVVMFFLLAGCGSGKGDGFVGQWTGENKTRMGKPTYVMNITKEEEIFHIDLETTSDAWGLGEYSTNKQSFEGKAESNSVLSMRGGLVTMRLKDKSIIFDGTEFSRSK